MIWIDITNLPHVFFFKDIIRKHRAFVTTRKIGNMISLLEANQIPHITVGKHGRNKKEKLIESSKRIEKLAQLVSELDIRVALSKHSVELPRVAFGLSIPCVQVVDNEHAEKQNRLFLSLCTKIIIPKATNEKKLLNQGADRKKIVKFYGICEYAHVSDFIPKDPEIKGEYILFRPEPIYASYFKGTSVAQDLISKLSELGYKVIVLPRGEEKYAHAVNLKTKNALNLIYHALVFIGGGGTMNREASLLGTPAISFYPNELLGVDKFLIEKKLLFHFSDFHDILENIENIIEMREELKERSKRVVEKFDNPTDIIEGVIEEFQ